MSSVRKIRCKSCQSVFKVRLEGQERKKVRCPQCDGQMVIGGGAVPKPKPKQRSIKPRSSSSDSDGYKMSSPSVRSHSCDSSVKKKKKKKQTGGITLSFGALAGIGGLFLIVSVGLTVMFLGGGEDNPGKAQMHVVANTSNNPERTKIKTQIGRASTLNASWVKSGTTPVDMFASSATVPITPPTIRYKWARGSKYSYEVSFNAELQGKKAQFQGITTLTPSGEKKSGTLGELERVERSRKGNGTGFVVSPDGYIVTCKHVVDGASKIEARVDGKMYPAKVLAVHKSEDLAILQVQAKKLPYVPIADSDKVNLGQPVRVIGFPVASVLGATVKFTQGNIAGIAEEMKRFQLDCVVNPGNSGGPAFNNKGEVIGVTDSKLVQHAISQVCFAIPTQPVEQFLKDHNVPYMKTESSTIIEPEDLVKKVKPAVVYIEVTSEPEKKGKSFEVLYSTVMVSNSSKLRTPGGLLIPIPRTKSEQGKVLVSELGQVHDYTGREPFPFMFDRFGTLIIEELPKHDMNEWGSQKFMIIGNLPCMVSSSYQVKSRTNEKMVISKKYFLRSVDDPENPSYKISGTGTLIFDKLKGVPENYQFKGEAALLLQGGTVRLRIPLDVSYRLRSQAEIDASKKKYEERRRLAEAEAKRLSAPPTASERATLLADLKSREHARMRRALQLLAKKIPLKPDKDISRAVLLLVSYKKDNLVKYYARTALKNWVAPESVRSISTMLKRSAVKKDTSLRLTLIEGLGASQSTSAAKLLVTIVQKPNSSDRYRAIQALKKLGSIAELNTMKLLLSAYENNKYSGCEILQSIGTRKSLPTLENIKNTGSSRLSRRAKRAIDAIKKRG